MRRAAVAALYLRAAVALIVAVGVSGCAVGAPAAAPVDSAGTPNSSAEPAPSLPTPSIPSDPTPGAPTPQTPTPSAPASVAIPSLALTEPLIDLGIQPDGSMEVPVDYDDVGWFTSGGRPGGIGPTVIAGHVDSPTGPAVFSELDEMVDGELVEVTDTAGTVFRYEVYRVGDYPKAEFPTEEVFGAIPTDEVRLITCTGLFDSSIGHYEDNRVVFARRV